METFSVHTPSSSGSFASPRFRSDRAAGYALIDGCNTKNHRLCRWLANSALAIAVPQPCRPILEHSISVCCDSALMGGALRLIPAEDSYAVSRDTRVHLSVADVRSHA
jgi:hypothetical protein